MPLLPPPSLAIAELITTPPSPEAERALRCGSCFLHVVRTPAIQTPALLAGYTPSEHSTGFYLMTWAAGARPFHEWRFHQALRPGRDPDLPEVAALEVIVDRWRPRITAAMEVVADDDDRREVACMLEGRPNRLSRTAMAIAWMDRFRHYIKVDAWEPYRLVGARLRAEGFEAEVVEFDRLRHVIAEHIEKEAPLDQVELELMARSRESMAEAVARWLDERRKQFEGQLEEEAMTILALRDVVPPPMPIDLLLLAHQFPAPAKQQS